MPAHPWLSTSPTLLLSAAANVPSVNEWLRRHTGTHYGATRVRLAAVKQHRTVSFTPATQELFEGGGGSLELQSDYPDGTTRALRIAEWASLTLEKGPAMHVSRPASLIGAVYWLIPCSPTAPPASAA